MAKTDKLLDRDLDEPPPAAKGGLGNYAVLAAVGMLAAAVGFILPNVWTSGFGSHAAKKSEHEAPKVDDIDPALVPFGDLVVNLADDKGMKYLRINMTLRVDPAQRETVQHTVEKSRVILKNWLISYLSDKAWDDVKGASGFNRARREIQDQFNNMLWPDGSEKIQDVLFEEFTTQ
jgi:flagellar FliL protein